MIFNIEAGGGTNTSDATATAADILSPKTAYIADGSKVEGTIQTITLPTEPSTTYNGSAVTLTISDYSARAINIPKGYVSKAQYYSISMMTLPTIFSNSSRGTLRATIDRSTETRYLNIGSGYNTTSGFYTIDSVPNVTLPTSLSNTSVGTNKLTITRSTATRYLNIPTGYVSSSACYTISSVINMTLPATPSSTSVGTARTAIGRSTSERYLNIPVGYNTVSYFYPISPIANGTAATPATTITANPTFSFNDSTGELTATVNASSSILPTVTEGYVSEGTAGTVSATGTGIYSMNVMTLPMASSTSVGDVVTPALSPSTVSAYINIPIGYNSQSRYYKVYSTKTATPPTSLATTGYGTLAAIITPESTLTYLNIPQGYVWESSYYKIPSATGFSFDEIGFIASKLSGAVIQSSNSLARVGGYAQTGITVLDMTQNNSMVSIPSYFCFSCSRLSTVSFNSSKIREVRCGAFYQCMSLSSVTGLENITRIGADAFNQCGLTSITSQMFLSSIISLGQRAFYFCSELTVIDMPNVQTIRNLSIDDVSIATQIFGNCNSLVSVYMSSLKSISGPFNVSSVFFNCSKLQTVEMPLLSSTCHYMFYSCASLKSISLPALTHTNGVLFGDCGLSELILTNPFKAHSASNVYFSMVYSCDSLSYISMNLSVSGVLSCLVGSCGALESVYFTGSCASYGVRLIRSCPSLKYVTIDTSTSGYFVQNALMDCPNLESFKAPNLTGNFSQIFGGVSTNYCGASSKLSYVEIPNVASIAASVFTSCSYLTEVILSSCSTISMAAFSGCYRLISLNLAGVSSVPKLYNSTVFSSTPLLNYSTVAGQWGSIYVPSSLYAAFQTATNWNNASIKARMVSV